MTSASSAPEPEESDRNPWGVIFHYPDWHTVELRWLPSTRDMSDEDIKQSLEMLAANGERLHPRFMIVDSTEFHHDFSEGVMKWREANIVPRYGGAGVTKFAFIVAEGFHGTVESGGGPIVDGSATFPTAWFSTRQRAYEWLASD